MCSLFVRWSQLPPWSDFFFLRENMYLSVKWLQLLKCKAIAMYHIKIASKKIFFIALTRDEPTFFWKSVMFLYLSDILICFVAVVQSVSCVWLCNAMDCSMPGFPVLHCLPKFAQIHVHWVDDDIQPSHPLSPTCPPALNLSQHWDLFQWVGCLHQVAKILEFRHLSFQWISRVDFPLGLAGLIFLQSNGLSRVFSSTTI